MDDETLDRNPRRIDANDFPRDGAAADQARFLLRYAILAPSSHNTQPWRFVVNGLTINVHADPSRWLRVADPDQRELYLSVGCALENLLVAAERFGFASEVTYDPRLADPTLAAIVRLAPGASPAAPEPALFAAIPVRHTNHRAYQASPIPAEHAAALRACRREAGVRLDLTDDPAIRRAVDDLIVRADTIQFADPAWRDELGQWIGQGVFGAPWLLAKLGQLAVSYLNMTNGTARQDAHLLMSAPLLGLISSTADDRGTRVRAGQAFERLCLTATHLGVSVQPMNQIVQLPALKAEVAALIPVPGGVPQIPFRLGFAEPETRRTPRRPLREALVEAADPGGAAHHDEDARRDDGCRPAPADHRS